MGGIRIHESISILTGTKVNRRDFKCIVLFLSRSMALSFPLAGLVSPPSSSTSMAGAGCDSVGGCSRIEESDDFRSTYGTSTFGSTFEFRGECSGHICGDEFNSAGRSLSSAMEGWSFFSDCGPPFFTSFDSSTLSNMMPSSSNGSPFDPLSMVSGPENGELRTATDGELLRRNNESFRSSMPEVNNPIPQLQHRDQAFETSISKKDCGDRLSDWREKVSSSSCLIEPQSRSAITSFTPQEPETGMSFSSEEEACEFYRKYAYENGFRVRLAKVERNSDGAIRKRHFYCSRQGFRSNKQSDKVTKYKRKETRTGCPAKVVVVAENGKWTITQVSLLHNHQLEVPNQDLDSITDFSTDKAKGRSEDDRRTQMEDPSLRRHNHELEVPNQNLDSFTDFSTDKATERSEDAQNLLNYFRRVQMEDPSFFYSVQVDSESRLKNFFWRDGRSKLEYEYFGDVLILDASFRTSRHGVICATFSGLNHHRSHILFGGAFLLDESIDSYIWLSETFMDSMNWRSPKTVFTDESRNAAIAVARIFPSTTHRIHTHFLCKNASKNLSTASQKSEFISFFPERLLRCQSRGEFELAWASFLDGQDLHDNPWLKNVYEAREKWSCLFCKPTFSAGVEKTTEFNENKTDVFDLDGLSLQEYIKQYEKETKRRSREEELFDFRCNQITPSTVLRGNSMEEEAAGLYTHKIFSIFQDELLQLLSVGIKETATRGTVSSYKVTQGGERGKYYLEFDCSNSTVHCSCRKFESVGVLSVHSLKVLNTRNIFHIPPLYLLKRWTKCAKDGLPENDSDQLEVAGGRFKLTSSSRLAQKALKLISKTSSIDAAEQIIGRHLDLAMEEVENTMKTGSLKLFWRKKSPGEMQSKRLKLTQNLS